MNHSEMERKTVRELNSKQLWNVNINPLKFQPLIPYCNLKKTCKFCESYDKMAHDRALCKMQTYSKSRPLCVALKDMQMLLLLILIAWLNAYFDRVDNINSSLTASCCEMNYLTSV